MKTFFVLSALLFSTITASTASACARPLPTALQKMKLDRLLSSDIYQAKVSDIVSRDPWVAIEQISMQGPIVVSLSNGCDITFTETYEAPTHPGMCPRFVEILAETVCND